MRTANRVNHQRVENALNYWNSLLQREAGRHFAALESEASRQVQHRIWTSDNFVVFEFDLPGHAVEDFEISLEKTRLAITVKAPVDAGPEGQLTGLNEVHSVAGTLAVDLPFSAHADQVVTTYAKGILKIVAERPADDLPRQLKVQPAE